MNKKSSHVKTFEITKGLLLTYKILGLFPLSLNARQLYRTSYPSLIYSWLTTALVAFAMYQSIVKRKWAVLSKIDSTLPTLMGYLEQVGLFLTIFIIFIKSLTNLSTKIRIIILNILEVDKYLLKVMKDPKMINILTSKVVKRFYWFLFMYLFTNGIFFIYKAHASPQLYWITIVTYTQYFLIFIIVVEYYTVLKLIQSRFFLLNECIKTLLCYRSNEFFLRDEHNVYFKLGPGHVSTIIEIKSQLETLHQVYFDMCDNCGTMNSNFSILFLFIITTTFLGTTTIVFVISNIILASLKGSEIGTIVFYLSYWLLVRCFVLIVIVTSSVDTSSEASKARRLAHRLLIEDNIPELVDDITLFANRLYSRKVQFTACGFFPLDFTLLYNIIGATTTYWIILIQFQLQTF